MGRRTPSGGFNRRECGRVWLPTRLLEVFDEGLPGPNNKQFLVSAPSQASAGSTPLHSLLPRAGTLHQGALGADWGTRRASDGERVGSGGVHRFWGDSAQVIPNQEKDFLFHFILLLGWVGRGSKK